MADKHRKDFNISFGKCKLKPIIRYYFASTLTVMDIIKNTIIYMFVGKKAETPESSHTAGRNII